MSLCRLLLSTFLLLSFLLCFFENGSYANAAIDERHKIIETHLLRLSSLSPSPLCNLSNTAPKGKGSLRVVHNHGPCSKAKRSSDDLLSTPTATIAQILSADQARVSTIQSRFHYNAGTARLRGFKVVLPAISAASIGSANYVVNVGLGTPKRDLSLIFDTGSDFTWTQCKPCVGSCYTQKDPTFDPSLSSTYGNISCNAALCDEVRSATSATPGCSSSTCIYGIKYGDNSFSIGYFAKEKLTLTRTDVFENFYFGCGQNNRGLFGRTAGLIGLGRDKFSIVSQTAYKYGKFFSYCLPTTSGSNGHLTFGRGNVPRTTKFTPLITNSKQPSFYFIEIIGISVGGRQLSIKPSVFKTGGTIIDSGTVITRLQPDAYSALKTTFRQLMQNYKLTDGYSILDTCYDFSGESQVSVPKIAFFFRGNVKLDIDVSGIFITVDASKMCLAFIPNDDNNELGIFGNFQQQKVEVVYNVADGKLGFAPGGCN